MAVLFGLLVVAFAAGVFGSMLGVGGGITADSDPVAEWQECLHKAAPILTPVVV